MTDLDIAHAALSLRLQIAVTALREASAALESVSGLARDIIEADVSLPGRLGDNFSKTRDNANAVRALVSAALVIAWGGSTDIPPELRRGMSLDPGSATRLLEAASARPPLLEGDYS